VLGADRVGGSVVMCTGLAGVGLEGGDGVVRDKPPEPQDDAADSASVESTSNLRTRRTYREKQASGPQPAPTVKVPGSSAGRRLNGVDRTRDAAGRGCWAWDLCRRPWSPRAWG
jgi:hypothetical protein